MKTVSVTAINRSAARVAAVCGVPVGDAAEKLITAHENLGIEVDLPVLAAASELDFASRKATTPPGTPEALPLQP